jgi:ABC-type nickel/cobalt efflux system permease component RcnA
LFRYFELQKKKSLNDVAFDSQVLAKTRPAGKGIMMKVVYNSMRIAAGLLVVVMAVWFIRERVRSTDTDTATTEVVDTYDDPKIALEETKKALLMISKSFGRAKEETKKINILNDAQQEIKKDKQGSQL